MGKWQKKLDSVLKFSQDIAKQHKQTIARNSKVADAAAQVVEANKVTQSRLQNYFDQIQDHHGSLGELTAELSVYETDLENAKKEKGKSAEKETKKLEKKMKPLAKAFDRLRKELTDLLKFYNQDNDALQEIIAALKKAAS